MRTSRIATLAASAALVGLPLAAAPASAGIPANADAHDSNELTAELMQLNDSGASGTAWAMVDGNQVEISLETEGLLDGAPHAQHIHIGGQNVCPANDQEGSGFEGALQTSDGADEYGAIAVSLTKEPGMTGAEHGLDVDNFPAEGSYSYSRTIEVSEEVAQQIADGDGVVVVHGVDHDGSGTYDGDTKSDLDPELPSEATDPAACGELNAAQMSMPHGGTEAGGTDTAGIEYPGAVVLGALAMGLGGIGLVAARRRTTN
ncbi:CHRD domain-containing protein [Promicromonospora umidemergens]|uniref:CHRD domain-containing protein n=1 Tax=Promicromonospora umidemergens TaxID=629679 RepID=A0ABP8XL98_9MICO|nr:CHRD domain-containing protein [Promicromonospora umidemergens]MCP2285690.1 CHRD domain-containing protein [Promicromonospora umidemergens]